MENERVPAARAHSGCPCQLDNRRKRRLAVPFPFVGCRSKFYSAATAIEKLIQSVTVENAIQTGKVAKRKGRTDGLGHCLCGPRRWKARAQGRK